MARKLVTVRRIAALNEIPGADRIEAASVDGWTCVVPVGQFEKGGLAVFFEIDSLLPAKDERFAAFAKTNDGEDIRLKTVRIRKVTSQGLLMPLATFPEIKAVVDKLALELQPAEVEARLRAVSFEKELGVRKFVAPEQASQKGVAGGRPAYMADFPVFIPRTDQERIQNMPGAFDEWPDSVFQETTKMDGSSMTAYFLRRDSPYFDMLPPLPLTAKNAEFPNGRFGVCSRNRDIGEVPNSGLFWPTALANNLPSTLSRLDRNIALQGELCGSSIQANFEGFAPGAHDFFLFTIWDVDKQRPLPPREVHEIWAPKLGVKHVPVVGYHALKYVASSVGELVKRADGKGINGKKREGIVLKHVDGKVSFKAISNSYLLKHGE
ncbi:RNA ligase, DRB0094 family [Thelonectria olida]|uniref:RNA ligase, DRB0094 family n=1 Tax=Thelonectria olida TaxID=1576542 RepID=A0A9P9AVW2_9HYPO|nr:RNA ligase, DRB0094 family [Thelonectria olida]